MHLSHHLPSGGEGQGNTHTYVRTYRHPDIHTDIYMSLSNDNELSQKLNQNRYLSMPESNRI